MSDDRSETFKRYMQGGMQPKEPKLSDDLAHILNRHSAENNSGTPDFILAEYLKDCLIAYEKTVIARAAWRNESVELPALQKIQQGKRTVPMVTTSPNGKMMNDIGVAEIVLTPGEQVHIGLIEKVVAVFEPKPDE